MIDLRGICRDKECAEGTVVKLEEELRHRKNKEGNDCRKEILLESLKFAGRRWNPYDTFPEENRYHLSIGTLQFVKKLRDISRG